MTDCKKTAPDALRTDRLLAVQNAMLTLISTYERKEQLQQAASQKPGCALSAPVERDETLHWERIHLASSARIAKDMAVERGVDPELAAIATALHDMGRIVTGKQKDHAHQGAEPARKLLEQLNLFSEEEIQLLVAAVYNHSDKDYIGTDIEEIVKDADVVDCFEFGMELPRPEQKARYQRYLNDHFGDSLAVDSNTSAAAASPEGETVSLKTADPLAKAMTLLKILGADKAKVIDPKQIVTAPWIRFKCQFECPNYGTRPTCPPQTPDHNATRELLDSYQTAVLFHRRSQADTGAMAYKAMRQLCLDGFYKAAAMGNGCGGDEPSSIPTMEACGIDVFETAKACGFEIDRVAEGESFVNFFGLVLVE